jgi:hypothetical protein
MVRIVGAPTKQVGVLDIMLGALGLTGAILLAAALVGLVVGGILIGLKYLMPSNWINGEAAGSSGLNLGSASRKD